MPRRTTTSAANAASRRSPWDVVIVLSGLIAIGALGARWYRAAESRAGEASGELAGGPLADSAVAASTVPSSERIHAAPHSNDSANPQKCKTCGAAKPRNFSHPVLARTTVAARSYLAAAAERGPLPEDVEELRALILGTGEGDAGDAAVYAVRAASEWLGSARDQAVARDTLDVLIDASSDGRSRVQRNATELLISLSGAM